MQVNGCQGKMHYREKEEGQADDRTRRIRKETEKGAEAVVIFT